MAGYTATFDQDDFIEAQDGRVKTGYINAPGPLHLVIENTEELVGNDKDVYGFKVEMEVADAEDGNKMQIGCKHTEYFSFGQPTDKDGGAFRNSRITTFLKACGKVEPTHKGPLSFQFTQDEFMNLQFVGVFHPRKPRKADEQAKAGEEAKPTYYEIDGLKMFHIDDPEVASVPKNQDCIEACIGVRWSTEYLAYVVKKREEVRKAAQDEKDGKTPRKTHGTTTRRGPTNEELAAAAAEI